MDNHSMALTKGDPLLPSAFVVSVSPYSHALSQRKGAIFQNQQPVLFGDVNLGLAVHALGTIVGFCGGVTVQWGLFPAEYPNAMAAVSFSCSS